MNHERLKRDAQRLVAMHEPARGLKNGIDDVILAVGDGCISVLSDLKAAEQLEAALVEALRELHDTSLELERAMAAAESAVASGHTTTVGWQAAEARLAKVPALVEALRRIGTEDCPFQDELQELARAAVDDWEQQQ